MFFFVTGILAVLFILICVPVIVGILILSRMERMFIETKEFELHIVEGEDGRER